MPTLRRIAGAIVSRASEDHGESQHAGHFIGHSYTKHLSAFHSEGSNLQSWVALPRVYLSIEEKRDKAMCLEY